MNNLNKVHEQSCSIPAHYKIFFRLFMGKGKLALDWFEFTLEPKYREKIKLGGTKEGRRFLRQEARGFAVHAAMMHTVVIFLIELIRKIF